MEIGVNDPFGNNSETQLKLPNMPKFWDIEGYFIRELVNVTEIYDSKGEKLTMARGSMKIPDDGVFYYENRSSNIKDLIKLEAINLKNISEIIEGNKLIRNDRETLENQWQQHIHWEDHIPFDNNWSTMMAKKQIKPTFSTVVFTNVRNTSEWLFLSQLIEYESMTDKSVKISPKGSVNTINIKV